MNNRNYFKQDKNFEKGDSHLNDVYCRDAMTLSRHMFFRQEKDAAMYQQEQQKQYQRQPQLQPSSRMDIHQMKWHSDIAAAKVVWGKLTMDEILASEGKAENLAALVCERYAIPRRDADEQVKNFLDKCQSRQRNLAVR